MSKENKETNLRTLDQMCQVLDVTADYLLAGNIYSRDEDEEAIKVCEEIMGLLQKCDAKQLQGIREIAEIYADGVRTK